MVSPDGLSLGVYKDTGFQGFRDKKEKLARILEKAIRFFEEKNSVKTNFIVLGIAGVFEKEEKEEFERFLEKRFKIPCFVTSDAELALYTATRGKKGILIIAGTGSIAVAYDERGQFHRIGGYGLIIDDEGSGAWVGKEAVIAAIKSRENRGPKTMLEQFFFKDKGIRTFAKELKENPASKLASFFPAVVETAKKDLVALKILERAADELIGLFKPLVETVYSKKEEPEVYFHGGIFKEPFFLKVLKNKVKDIKLLPLKEPVSYGAGLWGLELCRKLK